MLRNICISAEAISQVSEPWPMGLLFFSYQDYAPVLTYGHLKKNMDEICQQSISKALKLGE